MFSGVFILIYAVSIFRSTTQRWYHSPPGGEAARLHLWPTWFDFVECVCWPPARPGLLLISPLLFFIMFQSGWMVGGGGNRGGWGVGGIEGVGWRGRVCGQNQVYPRRLSERDGFIIRGISMCDFESAVTFSPSLPSLPLNLFLTLFLSLSSLSLCQSNQLPGQHGQHINQSVSIKRSYVKLWVKWNHGPDETCGWVATTPLVRHQPLRLRSAWTLLWRVRAKSSFSLQ